MAQIETDTACAQDLFRSHLPPLRGYPSAGAPHSATSWRAPVEGPSNGIVPHHRQLRRAACAPV